MIGIVAFDKRDILKVEDGKVFVRLDHSYQFWDSLCSVFTTDARTVAEAKEKGAKYAKSVVVNQRGTLKFDTGL